jgi:hypothetical protein
MNADPRQVAATALQFNTRKTAAQNQLGAALTQQFSGWTLQAAFYGGHRDVRQYLAIPLATQAAPTHSGGVVDLDRNYGGGSLRLTRDTELLGMPFHADAGRRIRAHGRAPPGLHQQQWRHRGLKRDEDDTVSAAGAYAQGEWRLSERWIALAGVRANRVAFDVADYFIAPGNGNDSGRKELQRGNAGCGHPVQGLERDFAVRQRRARLRDPDLRRARLPHHGRRPEFRPQRFAQPPPGSGCEGHPGRPRAPERGAVRHPYRDEIAIESNAGGRSTFKNVGPHAAQRLRARRERHAAARLRSAARLDTPRGEIPRSLHLGRQYAGGGGRWCRQAAACRACRAPASTPNCAGAICRAASWRRWSSSAKRASGSTIATAKLPTPMASPTLRRDSRKTLESGASPSSRVWTMSRIGAMRARWS